MHLIVLQLKLIERFDFICWRQKTSLKCNADWSGIFIFSTNIWASNSVLYKIIFYLLFLLKALVISEYKDYKSKLRKNNKDKSLIFDFNRLKRMVGLWKLLINQLFFKEYIYSSNSLLYLYELFSILLIRGFNTFKIQVAMQKLIIRVKVLLIYGINWQNV